MQGKTGVSGLAVAALAIGILLPLLGLLIAVPLAIVALVKISRSRQTGRWLAIFGIVAAVLWWVAFIILIVFLATDTAERDSSAVINEEGRIDFGDIRVGDCVAVPELDSSADIDPFDLRGTPCTASHNAEASAIVPVSGETYPGVDALASEAEQCPTPRDYAGVAGSADLQIFYLYPTEELWDDDDGHRVVCFIVRSDLSDTNAPFGQ